MENNRDPINKNSNKNTEMAMVRARTEETPNEHSMVGIGLTITGKWKIENPKILGNEA